MRRTLVGAAALALVVLALAGAIFAYIWFSAGSGKASAPISAPELVLEPGDTRLLFRIIPAESEVRFLIDETLLGERKTVIGVTDQVAGDLLVDFDDPANSQLGLIRINVRTLATDSEIRNRALRGQVLEANEDRYEFAQFVPTDLIGLPDTLTLGQPVTFQIAGQLTVHGVSREVTFDATVTPVSRDRLEGSAQTSAAYRDFDMRIPEAPGVTDVAATVTLEIDFVAVLAAGG
jgi:polyisoprenoid-binding protein YceI